ncbi:CotH kinase family protein [Actinoplanes sp. G11-F43]|uniref:CotH kinase family protein n=1 Tax=Actinoplanes sp. G11-F43 TaxID=3424130 RepID=UPI003D33311F
MRRRLVHRIPVRVRHYWRLLATCVATVVAFAVVFSTVRVAPLVTSASDENGDRVTVDLGGDTDLFDATVAHTIAITFRDEDYQRLLDAFWDEGEKEYLEADLTLDGTFVPSVGIRLKGNSTLQGLTRNGEARRNARGGGGPRGGGMPQGEGRPGGGRTQLKAEEPENLPWLIRFDEFVDGRRYQGHREISVRVGGMGGGAAVLNEAVSLDVLAAAGEPAQEYAYTSFTVNDRPTTARLIVEHPDENFADDLGANGVLYKSLSTSQFTDQGDDQTEYADDFKQINKKGSQDLQPVIDLIRWVNTATDAEFDAGLADRVDVESFARYAATQNLLVNFDDMAGPGRNYYLWYDLGTRRFSVVGWDYNLTLSGSATQDPAEPVTMGGGMRGGFQPPEGGETPGMPPGGRGGFGGGHKLKERFLAGAAFQDVYRKAYRELFNEIYGNAAALNTITEIRTVLGTVDGANAEAVATEAETLTTLIRERTRFLATHEVVTRN